MFLSLRCLRIRLEKSWKVGGESNQIYTKRIIKVLVTSKLTILQMCLNYIA